MTRWNLSNVSFLHAVPEPLIYLGSTYYPTLILPSANAISIALPTYRAVIAPSSSQSVSLTLRCYSLGSGRNLSGRDSHVRLPMITELNPSASVNPLKRAISLDSLHGKPLPFPMQPSLSIATNMAIFILSLNRYWSCYMWVVFISDDGYVLESDVINRFYRFI